MRGRSESNGGYIGHKVDEIGCGSPKKVTYDNG